MICLEMTSMQFIKNTIFLIELMIRTLKIEPKKSSTTLISQQRKRLSVWMQCDTLFKKNFQSIDQCKKMFTEKDLEQLMTILTINRMMLQDLCFLISELNSQRAFESIRSHSENFCLLLLTLTERGRLDLLPP